MFQTTRTLILIFSIFFSAYSLHLHDVSQNYITYLKSQQKSLKEKLDLISQKLSQNYKDVEKYNDIDKKTVLLEQYLREQRILLAEVNIQTIDSQLNISEWVCPILSVQKKNDANSNLAIMNENLSQIEITLARLDEADVGQGIKNAKQQSKSSKKLIDQMKITLASKGIEVDPSKIVADKKSNLNAPNWILDRKNINELNQQYKKSTQSGSIQVCHIKEPFFSNKQNKCIACNGEKEFFSLRTQLCIKCLNFDQKEHKCKDNEGAQITITNIDAGKGALIIPNDKNLNDIIKDNKKLQQNNKVKVCPTAKPFYNDFQCIQCPQNTLFSLVKKSCGSCQTGASFDKESNNCVTKSFYLNLQNPNWSTTKNYTQIQKEIASKQKNPLFEKCPISKPFSTGKQCINCPNDQHFDYDKKQCAKCLNNQIFNKNLHICSLAENNFQTNPSKAPNLIFEGRPKNEWMYIYYQNIEKNDGIRDCPQNKPYFDGMSCIVCSEQKRYFNLQYKVCQKCSEGTKYNQDHHECLTTEGNIAAQVPTLQKMAAGIFS